MENPACALVEKKIVTTFSWSSGVATHGEGLGGEYRAVLGLK